MLFKNAAQKIHVYAYDSTTGAPKTGDAANITGYVSLDGVANAIDDTNPAEVDATNMPGIYVFDLTAAETNCDSFALYAKSSTSNIRLEPIIGFTQGGGILKGSVSNAGFTPTATEFESGDITEATANHFVGRLVVFTSGALLNQATKITAYSLVTGRGHFTVDTMTEAPANTDKFTIF